MHILITGGAGFLGQRLAQQLLNSANLNIESLTLADVVIAPNPAEDSRVNSVQVDLSDPQAANALIQPETSAVYHLAAVVSGQAEADFDLGMAVNCDGTRHVLEATRHKAPGATVVFASSLAVFGSPLLTDADDVITDGTAVRPQSSYGTQKAIGELWVNDYSRKGFIDGRVLRLPTVCGRPGQPNAAASAFVSSLIREPLQGKSAICPVDLSLSLWLSSPEAVVTNLIHALTLGAAQWGANRTINLPGMTVTVQEMIAALERVAGTAAVSKIEHQPDPAIAQIVATWPSRFEVSRALSLGFVGDHSFDDIIRAFAANLSLSNSLSNQLSNQK